MSIDKKDLEFRTYDIGTFKSGTITHYPTGTIVQWYTSKQSPSEWRAREAALKELEKLINGFK